MKWSVYGVVRATKYIGEVEASTKEEAESKAWEQLETSVSVCHQCSDEVSDPEIERLTIEPSLD